MSQTSESCSVLVIPFQATPGSIHGNDTHRSVGFFFAVEAEAAAAFAGDIHGFARCIHQRLDRIFAAWRRAPLQLLIVLHKAAQGVDVILLPLLWVRNLCDQCSRYLHAEHENKACEQELSPPAIAGVCDKAV